MSDMISLRGKYFQVPRLIIQAVPIFMMYNMAGCEFDVFRCRLPGKPLSLPGLLVRSLLCSLEVSVVAFYRAVQSLASAYLAAWTGEDITTGRTSYFKRSVLGWVDPITLQEFPESLSGSVIPFGKFNQRDQVNGIGVNNVNFLFRCQSISHNISLVNG